MMSESTEFIIGSSVSCTDGPCGELTRVVVDPAARTVTHLVVGPAHGGGTSRLAPVRLAGAGGAWSAGQRARSQAICALLRAGGHGTGHGGWHGPGHGHSSPAHHL
jgi:hypothetical protein